MSILSPNDQRIFVQTTSPWAAAVPHSGGTATVASGDGMQYINCTLEANSNLIQSRVRTGSLGRAAGRRGRRSGSFSLEVPLQGSGTAGTAPDIAQVLTGLFGQAGTADPGVSVTYEIAETNIGLTIWRFKDPAGSNVPNECGVGGLINEFEISGGEEAESSLIVRGPLVDVIEKPNFSSLTTAEKFGLTSFPSEPSAPSFLGVPALAFTGSVTINGVSTFKLRDFRIYGTLNRSLRYAHGAYSAGVDLKTIRDLFLDFSVYEEDTSDLAALRHLNRTKGTFDASIVIGDVAGNIWTAALNNLAIGTVTTEESGPESILRFAGCQASETAVGDADEFSLVLT